MYTLRVHIIFLLLSIGFEWSSASPAAFELPLPVSSHVGEFDLPLETLHQEELERHDDSQTIDENGREQHLDCLAESGYIQEQISLITKMLSDGENFVQKQKDSPTDETILVLGRAGSGKTSLVQFLTGNLKLESKKVRSDTGEYIIEDGEKIGTSATESFTLYPEFVNYNSTINFCDSPGFHDSRSSAHEIVSMDVMKSVSKKITKVKILLLEKYSSLQYGFSKDSFINTLHHLNDFLVDIDKYKDHIVLIASKMPFSYRMTDEVDSTIPELITEEMHIESIMHYLNHTEISLAEKLNQKIGKSKRDFYQRVIKLLQGLQTRDNTGKAARISIFRRPYKSGSLFNMSLLGKNKESLTKTIMNLDAVEVASSDFDFTLSNEAKVYLECLLKLTSDSFKHKINELSFKLNESMMQNIQNYTSFHQVLSDLESFSTALKQLSQNLDETKNYNEFFEKINAFISEQNISSKINYNEQIHVLGRYEEMLMKFVDTDSVFSPSSWTLPIRQIKKSADDELQWYRSLNNFIDGLASYKIQKNKTEIHSTIFHKGSIVTNELMNLFVDVTGGTHIKQFIDAQGNSKRRAELESITNTMLNPSNITCDANGRLVVKGFQIRFAEVNSEALFRSYCNNITVKEVALLAVDTVYLDEDTKDLFRGVNLFIAAPKWEVIGQRRIVLSGQPGPQHFCGELHVNDSKNGRPGLPGDNGGSFFGIGLQFGNGGNLLIESNGGSGGPGEDGAKGEKGRDGRNAAEKLKLGLYDRSYEFDRGVDTWDVKISLAPNSVDTRYRLTAELYKGIVYVYAEVKVITKDGECGGEGGGGGFGGEAGMGGLAGDQQLIELSDPSQIGMQNQNGSIGDRGKMGDTGDRGKDGIGMICVQVKRENFFSYWKCKPTNTTSPACNTCQRGARADEHQYMTSGIEQPALKKSPDFSYYLLDYTVLLRTHTNHIIFNKIITDFQEGIQRKFAYSLNDLGLLFFKGKINRKF
ncbi:uncharacterized protein LOC111061520 [Nilaparvata lugens]|uniref:uncharacterized protein LOC111061520 n=1 Tax=Nilaparvata lugens TaxID=108931 RepID=UPI00193D79FD|nr:uncharacterized protein LOC111061520 [Nilaparvata lugens]